MKTFAPFLIIIYLLACKKKDEAEQTLLQVKSPVIIVDERIQGCEVANNSNFVFSLDSLVTDSVFFINNLHGYRTPVTLTFSLSKPDGVVQKTVWKTGNDPLLRTGQSIELDFSVPERDIIITAYLDWIPRLTGQPRADTITSKITIEDRLDFNGIYKGVSSLSPLDTFSVYLGKFRENILSADTTLFFGIKNFFRGFQYNLPVLLFSNGFGICQSPSPYLQRYPMGSKYYSQPYGAGIFSKNRDSLTVIYSFVEYENAVSFNNMKTHAGVFRSAKQ